MRFWKCFPSAVKHASHVTNMSFTRRQLLYREVRRPDEKWLRKFVRLNNVLTVIVLVVLVTVIIIIIIMLFLVTTVTICHLVTIILSGTWRLGVKLFARFLNKESSDGDSNENTSVSLCHVYLFIIELDDNGRLNSRDTQQISYK